MFQHARQFTIHSRQSLHRHADAPIVDRPRPRRRLSDIAEGVLRVQNHANRFRWREIQFRFDRRKVSLQRSQDVSRQRRRGCAAVPQFEVTAFVFLITFLFLLIGQCFVQRHLHFPVRPQRLSALPLRNRLVQFVQTVVGPAFQLWHVRTVWRYAPRPFQIIQGLLELTPPQQKVADVHEKHRLFRRVD